MVKARERMRKLGLQLSKVKKLASDWFKESVPFWRHNSSKSKIVYRSAHLQEISHLHAKFKDSYLKRSGQGSVYGEIIHMIV